MTQLAEKKCQACSGDMPKLTADEQEQMRAELKNWDVVEGHHLSKTFKFDDFAGALAFVNKAGEVAEAEGHHPNIFLTYGQVRFDIHTHKVDGLTEADFVLAAKLDRLTCDQSQCGCSG